jgi:hypothetical protein
MLDRITFEFAVYYLPQPEKDPLAEVDRILQSSFSEFQKVERIAEDATGLLVAPSLRDDVQTHYAAPGLPLLQRFGQGISREQAVTAWKGDAISGLLRNEPFHIPDLHAGQIVEVSESKVFDYLRNRPDGTSEGNETGKVMKSRAPPEKSAINP